MMIQDNHASATYTKDRKGIEANQWGAKPEKEKN